MDEARRAFLLTASAFAGWSLLSACGGGENAPVNTSQPTPPTNEPGPKPKGLESSDNRGMLIGPGGRLKTADNWLGFLALNSLEDMVAGKAKPVQLPLTFKGHAVVPHPVNRHMAGVFEKWGPGACEVDMQAMKVTRNIKTVPEREFYGHAAWAPDGSVLYTVESTPVKDGPYDGVIAVRDGKTLEIIGEFPTFGMAPHDCHLLDEGKTLGITNGGSPEGEPGCITFVDVASENLIERVTIPVLMAGHMAVTAKSSKGELAVGCTPHNPKGADKDAFKSIPGGLALRAGGKGSASVMSTPDDITRQMLGETLSLAIHESSGTVGATTPAGDIVTFWDLKSGKLRASHKLAMARGISVTLDQKHYVVTYGNDTAMVMIRTDDLSIVEESRLTPSFISGSHTIVYDL